MLCFVSKDLTVAQQTEFKEQRKTLKAHNDEPNEAPKKFALSTLKNQQMSYVTYLHIKKR